MLGHQTLFNLDEVALICLLLANTLVHQNVWLMAWNCKYPCHVSFSCFTDMDTSTYSLHHRGNSICYKLLWKPEFYFRVVHYF